MAELALPIVFFNLSGEMLYVIQERLRAQNISEDKGKRVIYDIIKTMFDEHFLEELFKEQDMYSRPAMKSVFVKLVHSSIMRLSTVSMSKLYDLMLMIFKYQVHNCRYPEDIFLVTLNHLDAFRDCTNLYPDLKRRYLEIYDRIFMKYSDLTHSEYESLYECITVFLQDLNIRVSILMKLGLQLPTGEIVLPKSENESAESKKDAHKEQNLEENPKDKWRRNLPETFCDYIGDRGTSLGTNIYAKIPTLCDAKSQNPESEKKPKGCNPNLNFEGQEETLLSRLIGNATPSESVPNFQLPDIHFSTCDEDADEGRYTHNNEGYFLRIDASQKWGSELGAISDEFVVQKEKEEKNDILELMDYVKTDN